MPPPSQPAAIVAGTSDPTEVQRQSVCIRPAFQQADQAILERRSTPAARSGKVIIYRDIDRLSMSWLRFLGLGGAEDRANEDIEGVRNIVNALDGLEPDRARYLAAFAYILSRVAHVDQHVSAEETAAIERIILHESKLPEAQAKLVVEIAKAQSVLFGGIEDFLVTRELSNLATHEEKLALLHCLFAVSAADQKIAVVEDNEIRRISRDLKIEHADFIAARLAHRQHL